MTDHLLLCLSADISHNKDNSSRFGRFRQKIGNLKVKLSKNGRLRSKFRTLRFYLRESLLSRKGRMVILVIIGSGLIVYCWCTRKKNSYIPRARLRNYL
jgi:hypothetical protein